MAGKILMVDDVPLFLEIQKGYLRMAPTTILTATNGVKALELARREKPDLIFMDLHMPGMDGAECCRQIKADPALKGVPVIMVTAAGKAEDQQTCQEAGCDDFLSKPVDRAVFLHAARQYMPVIDRRDRRVPCHLKARFKMHGVTLTAELADVSQNGVFVAAAISPAIGAEVEVSFVLPGDGAGEISAAGRVVWVNCQKEPRKMDLPPGFGVHLTKFGAASDYLLARYVESL
jgi:CheY-like chemotaxis protein